MVEVEDIKQTFDGVISNINIKCSNKEVASKLSKLSQDEKNDRLKDKMNPSEMEHYNHLIHEKKQLHDIIQEYESMKKKYLENGDDGSVKLIDSFLKSNDDTKFDDAIFKYEKRIFNNYKSKESKSIEYDLSKWRYIYISFEKDLIK